MTRFSLGIRRSLAWCLLPLLGLLLAGCGHPDGTFQLPEQASAQAPPIDWVYYFIFWLCLFYFVHIMGVMAWFLWRYRRRPGVGPEPSPHHNTPLEIAWSIPPVILVCLMFYWGFEGYIALNTPPPDSYKIEVTAKKWTWAFTYPDGTPSYGGIQTPLNPEREDGPGLHVPPNEPIELVMESEDVLHAFYVPQLRVKKDIVPGRFSTVWFEAIRPGRYPLYCAEYCGDEHSQMWAWVEVHESRASFEAWLEEMRKPPEDPIQYGKQLYNMHCVSCHKIDGSIHIGPSLKGVYGSDRKVRDPKTGKDEVRKGDEEYIRESIVNAGVLLSLEGKEFTDQMSAQNFGQRLKSEEVEALIAFIKSLSE